MYSSAIFPSSALRQSLNPHNVKNRGADLKGALDTLNAALHLRRSSWLQQRVKSRTTRKKHKRGRSSFSSHIYKHEICSTCRVLRPSVWVCARACYSLSTRMGDVWRHCVFAVHDHSERLAVVGLLEGGLTTDQHEEDDPQTPDICRDTERMSVNQNILAWHIIWELSLHFFLRIATEMKKKIRTTDQQNEAEMSFLHGDLHIEKKSKKERNKSILPPAQMKRESYSIRAISINMSWLRTHLSNRGWGSALLPAAGVMLTHTCMHALPHKHTVVGKWVNAFIPQSFTQMLISWNSSLGPIIRLNEQRCTLGVLGRSGQPDGPLTHIRQSYADYLLVCTLTPFSQTPWKNYCRIWGFTRSAV